MSIRSSLRRVTHLAAVSCVLAFSAGCGDATTPEVTSGVAAGEYVLESVSGRGPESGTFTLSSDGGATRTVRYPASQGGREYVLVGTYQLDATAISFALSESMISSFMWPVRGEWRGSSFTISYPDPADGPDIVETYRRR